MKKIFTYLGLALMLVVAAIAAYHFLRPNHIVPKAEAVEALWTPSSRFVQWQGQDIHVMEQGQGHPLLLVHGLGGNAREFDEIVPLLATDFRVIRFDLPGFGISDAPQLKEEKPDLMQYYGNFMAFMLEHAADDTLYLAGNSLGGWISWETALQHPNQVHKLILLAAAGYDMEAIAEGAIGWLNNPVVRFMIAKGLSEDIAKENLTFCTYHDESVDPAHFEHKYYSSNKQGNLDWMISMAGNQQIPDTQRIQQITMPTLILWGTEDPIIPYSHAAKFNRDIPNSRLITYKDCGHIPMIEYPEQTASDIRQFLLGQQVSDIQ